MLKIPKMKFLKAAGPELSMLWQLNLCFQNYTISVYYSVIFLFILYKERFSFICRLNLLINNLIDNFTSIHSPHIANVNRGGCCNISYS